MSQLPIILTVDSQLSAEIEVEVEAKAYKGGPRTPEGKARSRRNALKHGLRAEECLLQELQDQRDQRLQGLCDEIQPQTIAEQFYVGRAALAMARVEVAANTIEVEAEERAHTTLRTWKIKQRKQVRKIAQNLEHDPCGTVARLESTGFGIDWLSGRWIDLLEDLEAGRSWTPEQIDQALRLLGLDPAECPDNLQDNPSALMIDQLARATDENPEASAQLQNLVLSILDDLEELGQQLHQEVDRPKMRQVAESARIDDSPAGLRLQRYEREAEAAVHRNLKAVERAAKNRSEIGKMDKEAARPTPKTVQKSTAIPPLHPALAEAVALVDFAAGKAPNELPNGTEPPSIPTPKYMSLRQLKRQFRRLKAAEAKRTKAVERAEHEQLLQQAQGPTFAEAPSDPPPSHAEAFQDEVQRLLDVG